MNIVFFIIGLLLFIWSFLLFGVTIKEFQELEKTITKNVSELLFLYLEREEKIKKDFNETVLKIIEGRK